MTSSTKSPISLLSFLENTGKPFKVLDHEVCRTSEQSAAARASAGAPNAVGAKALVLKVEKTGDFVMCVLPGPSRLDGKEVRKLIGSHRFATADEVAVATDGLQPGMVPPFGTLLFPNITRMVVAAQLREHDQVGFNAACLTQSIVISVEDYFSICGADVIATITM